MDTNLTGWASTKPGVTKYHYYEQGNSLCSYQRRPGELHPYPAGNEPEAACSSCSLHLQKRKGERRG